MRDFRQRSRSPRRRSPGGGSSKLGSIDFDKTVFISNIPFETRWMDLKDLLREKAGEVSFVELLATPDGRSKGCAVVEFKEKSGAEQCLECVHRTTLIGREIVVKEIREPIRFFRKIKEETGVDFLGTGDSGLPHNDARSPGRSGRDDDRRAVSHEYPFETYGLSPSFLKQLGIDGPLTNRVFVANLQYTTPPSRIREVFSYAGKVNTVDLYLDKEGRSKGISVVEFSHPIEAVQAISMLNNQKYHERTLIVKMDRHDKLPERRPGEMPQGLSSVGMGLGANGAPLTNVEQVLAAQTGVITPAAFTQQPQVGGMMAGTASTQLLSAQPIVASASGPFTSGPMAQPFSTNGSRADLSSDFRRYDDRATDLIFDRQGSRGSPVPGSGGRGSGWSSLGRSAVPASVASGPPGCVVVFKNLPANLPWQRLKDFARDVGDCDYAEMSGVDEGKVRYKTAEIADRAIRFFNGRKYEGHTLLVELGHR